MICNRIYHTEGFSDAYIEAYIHTPHAELQIAKRKAIIVCPGGGYRSLSEREGEPIALKYFAAGLNAFVLRYSINEKSKDHAPLIEACLAIKYLREHADELHVDPDYIFITGFSAGGHLAAWTGTAWHCSEVQKHLGGAAPEICRPTATLPCYAVISSSISSGSLKVLNGYESEGTERFSVERLVDSRTSPAFLWHTAEDSVVSVNHSLLYATALAKNKIPFELHVFPNGPHGLALCNEETRSGNPNFFEPYNECWIDMAIRWVTECPFEK